MKSRENEAQLDSLLAEYSIENLEWPDAADDLDRFLGDSAGVEEYTQAEIDSRVRRVLGGTECEPDEREIQAPSRQAMLFPVGDPEDAARDVRRSGPRQAAPDLCDIVRRAYLDVSDGNSTDRLIADPDCNARFIQVCWQLEAQASQYELNHLLMNARKNKLLGKVPGVKPYRVSREHMDQYLFASEFALRILQDEEYFQSQRFVSLDRILCDPTLGQRFERFARSIAPGYSPLDYRWAAITIRKGQNRSATKASLAAPLFERLGRRDSLQTSRIDEGAGFFELVSENADIYIGHAENLRQQIERILDLKTDFLSPASDFLQIGSIRGVEYSIAPYPGVSPSNRDVVKTALVRSREPRLNVVNRGLHVA